MRDNLNSFAQVISLSLVRQLALLRWSDFTNLLLDDMLIDLSSGDVVILAQADIEVSLVVSEIQITLSTIVQDVYLTCSSVQFQRKNQELD